VIGLGIGINCIFGYMAALVLAMSPEYVGPKASGYGSFCSLGFGNRMKYKLLGMCFSLRKKERESNIRIFQRILIFLRKEIRRRIRLSDSAWGSPIRLSLCPRLRI